MALSISEAWQRFSRMPMGKQLFSRFLGYMAPYSGSIGATVLELREGHAEVELRERRAVRNHLRSIHAIALMNLGELSTGLAVLYTVHGKGRGIVTSLKMEYLKKARGRIVATCDTDLPSAPGKHEVEVSADLRDDEGELVAKAWAVWKIEIKPPDQGSSQEPHKAS